MIIQLSSVAGTNMLAPTQFVSAASLGADYTSATENIQAYRTVCLELQWTGTPTGTITIYGSVSGTNFYPLPSLSVNSPAGSADGTLVDLTYTGVMYVYVQYTRTSGTGTLNAYIGGKP